MFLIYVNRSELLNNHHLILAESKKLFCFSQKHVNANCNTSVISLAANPSYKGYSHAAHQGITRSTEYIFSLFVYCSFPPPLTLNTLIYLLISRISLTRDYSPPETNQLTHRDYCSVYAQVNLHLKSYSHACASVSLEINSQGVYWESQKGVWGHYITWSDLHHSAALHLFRTHPKRAAKSLSKVEHIGLWLHPPALAALDICCSQTDNINSTLKLLHIMPWAHRLLDPFSAD